MSAKTLADWLEAEPFTLALSAGFFGFYAHAGVILALEESGIRPSRVVGSSAGAIAGGVWAAGVSAADLRRVLEEMTVADFWDPTWHDLRPGVSLRRWRSGEPTSDPGTAFGVLRGRKFDALLARALDGVERIEDCQVEFAAVTHELRRNRTVVHERGPLRAAIRASAALPVLFGPVRIDGRLYADGGISDRPGSSALRPKERTLYHHLPHVSKWPRLSGDELAEQRSTDDRRVLVVEGLPRVHPGALERGPKALARARESTLRALGRTPIPSVGA